jgi:hypothetical protein
MLHGKEADTKGHEVCEGHEGCVSVYIKCPQQAKPQRQAGDGGRCSLTPTVASQLREDTETAQSHASIATAARRENSSLRFP